MNLHCVLLSDGSSDRALMPISEWLLQENGLNRLPVFDWADPRHMPPTPRSLSERMISAIDLFDPEPCDLLFAHRDAEGESHESRVAEIRDALNQSAIDIPVIPVVPVRMLEAWLLIDEAAL